MCLEAIVVHTGYHGLLCCVGGLLIHDAGKSDDLVGCQSQCLRLSTAVAVPEDVLLGIHACEEFPDADVPIHFVGVGDEQAHNRFCILAEGGTGVCIVEKIPYL